jgi:hypothetical protein
MLRKEHPVKRAEWTFEYTGKKLALAARAKLDHHQSRMDAWKLKKQEVINKIRGEGLEIDERIALGLPHPKPRDWERGAQVMIRNDLREDLDEILRKLAFHANGINDYEGWVQVLEANPDAVLHLDHEDYLFFFGHDK